MEKQVNTSRALTIQDLKDLDKKLRGWNFKVDIISTNDLHIKQLTISQPSTGTTVSCLIHFDDPDQEVNTLEDGGQICQEIENQCQPGEGLNLEPLKRDVATGGWKIAQNHVYINTNKNLFTKDLLNLATIMTYVKQHPANYIKNVK